MGTTQDDCADVLDSSKLDSGGGTGTKRASPLVWPHLLSGILMLVVCAASPALAQTTWVVDDDGRATATDCNARAHAFKSVQEAVNAAAPGDTILICPGTYDEQVVVTKSNLTIRGAGAGLTVLRPTT